MICSTAPLPSAETAVATKITRNISTLADGSVSLCAAGKNDIGQWQGAPTKAYLDEGGAADFVFSDL